MSSPRAITGGLSATLLAALAPSYAAAYDIGLENGLVVNWDAGYASLNYDPDIATNQASFVDELAWAEDRFYEQASLFWYWADYDDDDDIAVGNDENELAFTANNGLLCGTGADGCAWTYTDGNGGITESDVFLDSTVNWTTSSTKTAGWAYGGGARLFQATLLHELGHFAGLGHENGVYNIMGKDWDHVYTNGSSATAFLGEDATSGLRALYGDWSAQDLAVVHWKWDPATTGDYSSHMRTQVFDTSNKVLASVTESSEPYFKVSKGQRVRVEFTYLDNGSSNQSTVVKYYLSTNNYISSFDTLLASAPWTMTPDAPYTGAVTLTIPSTLTSGTKYWVGAIIDSEGTLAEFDEANNAAYVGIKVN